MDESLLNVNEPRVGNFEEEALWNELTDQPHDPLTGTKGGHVPQGIKSGRGNVNPLNGSFSDRIPSVAPHLPSLRAHVHLPAISSLFRGVVDTTKSSVLGRGGTHGESDGNRSNNHRSLHVPDEFGNVPNLDAFLINLYNYYYHKGFWCIVVVEIVGLLTGLFSVSITTFLLGCVQWESLINCHKNPDKGCRQELEKYITCKVDHAGLYHLIVAFYFAMFFMYWMSRAVQCVRTMQDAREMRFFYTEKLHIDDRQVQTIKWDEIVQRVLNLIGANVPTNIKQLSSYKLQIDPSLLSTPHDFARRIMRRENYLIACMNHALFQGQNLLPTFLHFASTSHVLFSRNMECNINIVLIDQMFDAENNISPKFLQDVKNLQKRFMIAGVLNFILTPFLLLYRIFHFFFLSAQEWHLNRTHYFGTRRWSSYALWKFREYNELPHVLDQRIDRSYALAEKYLSLFPAGPFAIIAGGISFCASSIMAVLIAISVMEESILLETTLYDRQLLWYLTIATGVFALARTFTSNGSPFMTGGDSEEAMMQLAAETHHFPKEWHGQCHTYEIRDAFLSLFPYKALLFAQECLSVIMAPYILCISLPNSAREILLFIRSHTLDIPHAGSVCRFAEFDFKRYGNDPKMEASFVNFKTNHPKWVGQQEGEALMQRLGRFKEEEMEKSMRLGDTMYASHMMSMSHQLMQSQAIHTALGHGFGANGMPFTPTHDNQFYWLEKLHQQGGLGDLPPLSPSEFDETKEHF